MNSNKTKAGISALLLFGLGIAVGALGHRYFATPEVNAKTAEDFRHKYVSEMQMKLQLSQHQVDQLQVILDDTKVKFRALRDTQHPEMEAIKADQVARVKSILSPDQVTQYQKMVAAREQQAKQQDDRERKNEQHQRSLHLKALEGK